VGKTTVLSELADLARENKYNLTVMNFGTIMKEIMLELGKELHRDEMRKLTIEEQRKFQELAASEITHRAGHGVAVIDTHMFVKTPSGMWAGLPEKVLEKLDPQLLVLVEANTEQIATRRAGDSSRRRDQSLADEIAFDLGWSRATAAASAVATGAPVKVIRNDAGRQKEAAQELFQTIRGVMENQT